MIELVQHFSIGSRSQQRHHHNEQQRDDERRKQLVNSEDTTKRLDEICQISTVAVPESMPAIAPNLLVRRQYSEQSISGPNEAPKPAHAYETTWKIDEF